MEAWEKDAEGWKPDGWDEENAYPDAVAGGFPNEPSGFTALAYPTLQHPMCRCWSGVNKVRFEKRPPGWRERLRRWWRRKLEP